MVIFCVREEQTHLYLFERCLAVMSDPETGLKRDIRDNECPGHLQNQLKIQERWLQVQYPSRHWIAHLERSKTKSCAIDKTDVFLKEHFLHWLEALAYLGVVSAAVGELDIIKRIVQGESNIELSEFLHDARRFLLKNRWIVENEPLQLYYAGLIFAPLKSVIRNQFKKEIHRIYTIPTVEEFWSAELETLEGHLKNIRSVVVSPDSQTVASGSDDLTIKFWDARTGEELRTLTGHSSDFRSVTFSPDSQMVASGSHDKTIKLWDARTGKELRTLRGHSHGVQSVTFSPDSQTVASGSKDWTIKLWDAQTGEELRSLAGHSNKVTSIAFFPNSQMIVSGSNDTTIKIWDTWASQEPRTLVRSGHSEFVRSVAVSPDSQMVASGSWDNTIKLWDAQTGQELRTLTGHSYWVCNVVFSPDGQILVSGSSDNTIKLWDVRTGKELRTFTDNSYHIHSIVFSPNGRMMISGSVEKAIKLWDPWTGQELWTLVDRPPESWSERNKSHFGHFVFSPGSQTVLSVSSGTLWDVHTGRELRTLRGSSRFNQVGRWSKFAQPLSPNFYSKRMGHVWKQKAVMAPC
ncbi:hypothetical protein N7475_007545 [Penicillium sp. IBT 31633x]|nr:hypothetical protein N7475_007545 [Penicillium sp. IBT 31633x]